MRMHNREQARRKLGHVSVVPPDPSWPEYFSRERDLLRPVLGRITDELQHYGSTAVPGLSAKPIIDMMAPVASLDEADALGYQLANIGYSKIDAGFFKRRFFRKKTEPSEVAYHLHLVVSLAWPLKNELLLRDWLIQHPEIAHTYEKLKTHLAAEYGHDMPRYTEGKTSFLRRVVNEARLHRGLPLESDWDE
jgi:GrpB-like predicted nucleotidyltransferase (UPF0157 family)